MTGPIQPVATTTGSLSRTGADPRRTARLAPVLVVLGMTMVGLAWRDGRYAATLARRPGWPPRRSHRFPWR